MVGNGVARLQIENAVGKDVDHVGISEALLVGLRAVVEMDVSVNVVGGPPLREKSTKCLKPPVCRVWSVIDVPGRSVCDEEVQSTALAQPIEVQPGRHLLGH